MRQSYLRLSLLAFLLLFDLNTSAQTIPDPQLLAEITKIKAIDTHAHPLTIVKSGDKDTEESYVASLEPLDIPVRLRADNPEYIRAWRALYGYKYSDMAASHVRELMEIKQRVQHEQGDRYPIWVLDQLGIEVMFANRVTMIGPRLAAPRFRWVPFADPLLFPLNNFGMGLPNPDYRARYEGADRVLKRYLKESGVARMPATLDEYLRRVVSATLQRQQKAGAIALKFATAYHRTLDFKYVAEGDASRVYSDYIKGGVPPTAEYKALQDFLFRYIAREAGRLGLPLQIHVGAGASGYFDQRGANPFTLEPVLNDPELRGTKFILLHGGFPFAREARALAYKPNVYLECSGLTFSLSPRELSEVLRSWLEFVPEKVLFGTDAFEISPEVNWADHGWLTVSSARKALAIALTGMVNDGDITRDRALALARMVIRDNAIKLFKLQQPRPE